jgi:mono/diheme cytochrome c family protein
MNKSIFVAAAATLLLLAPVALAQEQAPHGNAKVGRQLFHADGCYECHGTVGQGGGLAGPRLSPMALPFAVFVQQLREPVNNMPPYEPKVLSNADVANIYVFLRSIPKPPPVADIPALRNLD